MLRALGSNAMKKQEKLEQKKQKKKLERQERRAKKKSDYALYLKSDTWRKIRLVALKRDKHTCRACGDKAYVVHHVRYPKHLGQERQEWLYSLCSPCHDLIHELAGEKMTLAQATAHVLALPSLLKSKVVVLEDDWRLSSWATRQRQLGKKSKAYQQKKPKKRKRNRVRSAAPASKKRAKLDEENDRLHAIFRENRERRERMGR